MAIIQIPRKYFSAADALIFLLIGTVIYGIVSTGQEWGAEFHAATNINLDISALPQYALFSAIRALVAYGFSLLFTIILGYAAAKSKAAEKIIIPAIDILQSVPVLAFLPGLVLGLIALFPKTNFGLELAAILMIFTSQVWNMTFSFYSSLKSLPESYHEASAMMGFSWWRKLLRVELPFSAIGLAWNSLMSMAGGWFFLSVCEAFTLADREYRLPGIGAYMAVAFIEGNTKAIVAGVIAIVLLIVTLDFVLWRPVLAWVARFRIEADQGTTPTEPFMMIVLRESKVLRIVSHLIRKWRTRLRQRRAGLTSAIPDLSQLPRLMPAVTGPVRTKFPVLILGLLVAVIGAGALFAFSKLVTLLSVVEAKTWGELLLSTLFTLLRVSAALLLSSLWAVPIGIWIGTSARRVEICQPIVQVLASFPAPMVYPLAMLVFGFMGIGLGVGSIFLMLLGVQWYILFNVIAGAMRISRELEDTAIVCGLSMAQKWKTLYIPSVFPNLVTGWITAAGGAWNASIVTETVLYRGQTVSTAGLGSQITASAATGDFHRLAAAIVIMIAVVILINRYVWAPVYSIAQTRFRME